MVRKIPLLPDVFLFCFVLVFISHKINHLLPESEAFAGKSYTYFDNIMTKFKVNNRIDA